MTNPLIGEILSSVLGGQSSSSGGGLGGLGGLGNILGSGGGILGGLTGGNRQQQPGPGQQPTSGGAHGGLLLAMLLPLAMRWVQNNGGVGAVLDRFRQSGYGQQASSWVSTGANHAIDPDAVRNVVGAEQLSQFAQQLGVPEHEIANGFSQILPEMVDKLSPQGEVPPQADDQLSQGLTALEHAFSQAATRFG